MRYLPDIGKATSGTAGVHWLFAQPGVQACAGFRFTSHRKRISFANLFCSSDPVWIGEDIA